MTEDQGLEDWHHAPKLERDGEVRKTYPVGWVVLLGGPRDHAVTIQNLAYRDEVLTDQAMSEPLEVVGLDGTKRTGNRRVAKQIWIRERGPRTLLKFVAEPIYERSDLELFKAQPDQYLILDREKERDAWTKKRRIKAQTELAAQREARRQRDEEYIKQREAELNKLLGRVGR